ncbi:Response regulator [Cystobacter fuscus DSM 2262]|uniref:Response regulator n=1 Tax=Cystobacter fuscus (strain ATCC 25194 / DSM 2262 / NBRC 100088 / M29) TaxID=1242864 RepID=S9P3J8_CYSF2|nr:DUF4388 domain-containing protein [Cystobacter fuscus]EPX57726.1 Response regulator [Cystobacter fuscus DSM 2262]
MALTGTLKDFGIADILQLIGQQQKTGVLYLKSKDQDVQVFIRDGNIVRAESVTRKKKDLLGNMLVSAELITPQQLESALEIQKRTLKRLGDVLTSTGAISAEKLKQMMRLQVTESLYGLFSWKAGDYEFKQEDSVQIDQDDLAPLRAESVLMEGFRMVDEWPHLRKKLSNEATTFEKLKELPPQKAQEKEDDFDASFDDAFSEEKKDENKGEFKSIGSTERRVYSLIGPGRDVRKLVDLSCLGEFETWKALVNLLNLDYIRALPPSGLSSLSSSARGGDLLVRLGGVLARAVVTLLVIAALGFVASRLRPDTWDLQGASASSYSDPAAQRLVSRAQQVRIQAALEVFRLEKGNLPERLDSLVEVGLLRNEDLRYPWRDDYYYRRTSDRQFILLPPLR